MKYPIFSLLCLAGLLLQAAARAQITLVQDGTPRACIVVSPEAAKAIPALGDATVNPKTAAEKAAWAARDLQAYLQKLSGASLAIVADDGAIPPGPRVLVGHSRLTAPYEAKIPMGVTTEYDEEGYAILADDDILLLAGNDAYIYHGTEYAVSFFLHRLGVRWYMPGDYGEVIPRTPTIAVGRMREIGRPDFKMRNWWTYWMAPDLLPAETRWKIHNGMNVDAPITFPADGSVRNVLPPEKEKDNPAYADVFARDQAGRVYPYMPNLASEISVQYAAKVIKDYFRAHPETTSWGIGADDGLPRDFSAGSQQLHMNFPSMIGCFNNPGGDSTTEEWMQWVQRVAAEVYKEFPDHIVSTNGYANRDTPPQLMTASDPKIWIMFAAIWCDTYHAMDNPRSWMTLRQRNMIAEWTRLYRNVYMYDYIYTNLCGGGMPPVPLAHRYLRDMPILKRLGVVGFSDEGRVVRGESGVFPTYLRARMMWDADLDGQALMDEYFANWYGPAAAPARAFWEAMETAIETSSISGSEEHMLSLVYTPELIKRLEVHLKAAEAAAKGNAVAAQHVLADRVTFDDLVAYKAMERAENDADYAEAVKQAERVLSLRKPAMALSRFYWDEAKPGKYGSAGESEGFYYWGTAMRRDEDRKVADRITGKTGELVAVLPERAKFSLDPADEGRFNWWYRPDFDDHAWANTLTTVPFFTQGPYLNEQGFPYMGTLWYRLNVKVPATAQGKTVRLYAAVAETEAWVWVNGQFVGHRPYIEAYIRPNALDFDVTRALLPGKTNSVVVRLHTNYQPSQMPAGLASRLFLYAPKERTE